MGAVMAILDVTAVNVAFSDIESSLGVSVSGLVWVADGYTLIYAAMLFLGASLASRYGARLTYLTGLLLFVVASLCCVVAPTGNLLISARFFQGAGAAIFTPSALSLITDIYKDERERAKAMSKWISMVSIAAVVGPLLSGILIHLSDWRLIFLVNIPFGGLAIFMTFRYVRKTTGDTQARINLPSHLLLALCLGATSFVLIEGARLGWTSPWIGTGAVIAVAAGLMMIHQERKVSRPIFPPALLARRGYLPALGAFTTLSLTFYGQLFVVGLMMQKGMGYSALDVGLRLLPAMAIIAPANLISGRMNMRYGVVVTTAIGLACAALGALLLMMLERESTYWLFVAGMTIANFGNGMTAPALTIAIMQRAAPDYPDIASGMLNFGRQIGALLGFACAGITLSLIANWNRVAMIFFFFVVVVHILTFVLVLYVPSRQQSQTLETNPSRRP